MLNIPDDLCTVVTIVPELIDKIYTDVAYIQNKSMERIYGTVVRKGNSDAEK